jgi:hypothetical protein
MPGDPENDSASSTKTVIVKVAATPAWGYCGEQRSQIEIRFRRRVLEGRRGATTFLLQWHVFRGLCGADRALARARLSG